MNNLAALLGQYRNQPQKGLYRQWRDGQWRNFHVADLLALAARWQQAFRGHGLQPGDRVALALRNGVDWVAVDQAALGLGLVVVPLYIDDHPENLAWCLSDSGACLLVAENPRLIRALIHAAANLPPIVCLHEEAPFPSCYVEEWLPAAGAAFTIEDTPPDTLATVVYTSGTTGRPKGVMLSHGNILANIEAILQIVPLTASDRVLSVLPLTHMFERTCGYYVPLRRGVVVIYMRSIHQLAEDLATQQPTVMIAVPRIFERFLGRIEQALAASTVKRLLFYATTRIGWRLFQGRAGFVERLAYPLLRRRVAAPVLARLGGKLRFAVSGGAPLESRVASAIVGLGLPLIQGYGLTEASPVVCANQWGGNDDPLSVGPPLPGVDVRINLEHELLVCGPSVMLGYWNNPDATRAVIDGDGWFNTGDLAEVHGGRIYIKGRSKDILVLSNGEKASPDDIETAILDDPLFEQVMVVGEGRPFLVLLAVSAERDARKLLRHANARVKHLPRHCRLRRVIALHEPWTLEARLLTPTLKVKRDAVYHCFQGLIDDAYARR